MARAVPRLGAMNERIEILRHTDTSNESGGVTTSFSSIGHFWADISAETFCNSDSLGGRGREGALTVILRFRSDVVAGDHLIHRNQAYEIQSAGDVTGRKSHMRLRATRIDALGGRA